MPEPIRTPEDIRGEILRIFEHSELRTIAESLLTSTADAALENALFEVCEKLAANSCEDPGVVAPLVLSLALASVEQDTTTTQATRDRFTFLYWQLYERMNAEISASGIQH